MNNIITKELKGQDVVPVLAVPVTTVGRVYFAKICPSLGVLEERERFVRRGYVLI